MDSNELRHFPDNATERAQWWSKLSDLWKVAFSQGYFNSKNIVVPDDDKLVSILSTPVIRLVGPSGYYPNISIELGDMEGLAALVNLQNLFVSFTRITSLSAISHLINLQSLYIHDNTLTSLEGIETMANLTELYCQNNQIKSLRPLASLANLSTVYCTNNLLEDFEGITESHQKLSKFYCLPNAGIQNKEIKRIQNEFGIRCLNG